MKKLIPVSAVVSCLVVPIFAHAQTSDSEKSAYGYIGGNYGYLKVKSDDDFEDDNDAYQGYLGAAFNPYVAIELGYMDLGSYGSSQAKASTEGVTANLRLTLPVTPFLSLYAKGGQLWWETDYNILGVKGDADGSEPFYGVGVGLALSEQVDLNVEYTRYEVDLDHDEAGLLAETNSEQDIDYASIGLRFKF